MNPDSLVARIYKARYYPHGDVLQAKLGSSPSYAWRSIKSGLEVIKRGTRWRVGNGNLIHIWEDKWMPTPTTYKVIPLPRSSLKISQWCQLLQIKKLEDGKLILLNPFFFTLKQIQS